MAAKSTARLVIILALLLGLIVGLPFLQYWLKEGDFYGHYNPQTVPAIPDSSVPAGRLNLVFFGFGDCADTCPAQLANLLAIREYLGPEKVQFTYVSLDADQQKQKKLQESFDSWDAGFKVYVPGSVREAQQILRAYGGIASDRGNVAPKQERFSHDGWIYVTDEHHQRLLTYISPALDIPSVVDDLRKILNKATSGR